MAPRLSLTESGESDSLRAVHLSRHKWPGISEPFSLPGAHALRGRVDESTLLSFDP